MQKRAFWFALVPVVLMVLGWLGWTPPALALTEEQRLVSEVWRVVNRAYIDETFNGENWWKVRQQALRSPLRTREDAYEAIEEMLAKLDDPFTRLLRPDRYRNLQVNTAGELTGVGLQIAIDADTKQLKAIAPIAGAPADLAGIQPGDVILAIDGVSTESLTLDEAAGRMRGPVGTEVTLQVERFDGGAIEDIALVRDRIALHPVTADLRTVENSPNTQIGYIRLTQFSANAAEEMAEAIESLENEGADAFVLDLRNNPGGLLQAGIEVARLWLNDATIVYTVNRQSILGSFDAGHEALTDAPLVVLVNPGTASASEILAGALQDNGRAKLVGERTFGKGLIQSLFDLSDDSGLAVTVAKYETPNHKDINKLGITPDFVVKQNPIQRNEVGTESDRPYQTAVELLTESGVVAKAG
ncbi:carboxyl-terminal protease [Leptolyngbya valderiana BDU 20041]|nr:carboxyl-terminal protease [Leptolyngbya valderiana BDU 20041]PPT08335.1 Periplasmic protease [Geitlerinema sp. FC II]